jgi:hypothetical protein
MPSASVVADPEFLSRILIFSPPESRIQDLRYRIQQQKKGKNVLRYFFVGINFTKLKIILFLNKYRNHLSKMTKNVNFCNPKIFNKLSE